MKLTWVDIDLEDIQIEMSLRIALIIIAISVLIITMTIVAIAQDKEIKHINLKVDLDDDIPRSWNYSIFAYSNYNVVSDVDTIQSLAINPFISIPLYDFNAIYEYKYTVCIYLNNEEDNKECIIYFRGDIKSGTLKEIKLEE